MPTRKSSRTTNALKLKADENSKARYYEPKEYDFKNPRSSPPPPEDFTRPPDSSDSVDSSNEANIPSQYSARRIKADEKASQLKERNAKGNNGRAKEYAEPVPTSPYRGSAFHRPSRSTEPPKRHGSKREIPETQSQSQSKSGSGSQLMSHMDGELGGLSQKSKSKSKTRTFGSNKATLAANMFSSSAPARSPSPEAKPKFRNYRASTPQDSQETPKKTFKRFASAPLSEPEVEERAAFKKYSTKDDEPLEAKPKFKSFGNAGAAVLDSPGSVKRTFKTHSINGVKGGELSDSDSTLTDISFQVSGDDDPKSGSRPSPRKKRFVEPSDSSTASQKPIFEVPASFDSVLSDDALSSLNSTPSLDDTPPETTCPMCGDAVPRDLLMQFSANDPAALSTRAQARFCTHHRRHAAMSADSYPAIAWALLPARIRAHVPFLAALLATPDAVPSHYRQLLAADIAAGRNRTLKQSIMSDADARVRVPGYYGPRGGRVMQEEIMEALAGELREAAVRDSVVSARGVGVFVVGVLVLEVGIRLVMEDLGVKEEEAREVMERSAAWGTLVNEEIEERRPEGAGEEEEGDDYD